VASYNDKDDKPGNAILLNGAVGAARPPVERRSVSGDFKSANREIGAPGWHSRGYLPHFDSVNVTQHVTFHLSDSLPQTVLQRLDAELKSFPKAKRDIERRKKIEAWIDAGHGSCILRDPAIASMVQKSLLTFDALRYRLLAWVVMPNHVHVLFQPIDGWTVAKIVASWKKFTARQIFDDRRNRGEASDASVWHREYWDRFIRDHTHLLQAIEYIHNNPVKAALVKTPESWPWSSAYPGNHPGNANLPIGGGKEEAKPAIRKNGVLGEKL